MFNTLTETDKDYLTYWIENYANSQETQTLTTDLEYILRFWSKNKESLYHLLGDNLIVSKELKYTKSIEEAEQDYPYYFPYRFSFKNQYQDFLFAACGSCKSEAFVYPSSYMENYPEQLRYIFECESLFYNTYTDKPYTFNFEGRTLRVDTGCKVSKLLGKIVKTWPNHFNPEDYEDFRIKQSQFTNQRNLIGNLCLSIHPLDFLTMSDNDEGWDSCMSWREHGDYRMGTVEMMNSPCVVEAYLTAAFPMKESQGSDEEPAFQWNSKKWRQLFIVSPDIIMAIKPYPYYNEELTTRTLKWLKQLASAKHWGPYSDNLTNFTNRAKNAISDDSREIYIEINTNHMYNDVYGLHPGYMSKNYAEPNLYLNYSGESECMVCGDLFNSEKDVVCSNCSHEVYCCECGDSIPGDEAIYDSRGNAYCSYCAADKFLTCENCGDSDSEDYMYCVNIYDNEDEKNWINTIYFCSRCFNNPKTAKNFGEIHYDGEYFILLDELNPKARELYE